MLALNTIHLGDCLTLMSAIPDSSIDMILCDLPYGTTYASWDKIIPMDLLWIAYSRIAKPSAPMVFTASQPFTSLLVCSKPEWFRTEWIWDKENAANFANANRQPLKQHESIIVFSKSQCNYYPQKTLGKKNHSQGTSTVNHSETRLINKRVADDTSGMKFPKTILRFPKHSSQCGLHPTQKPVALFEYLVRTYSKEGDVVLDNCIGSGTTAVACISSGRSFIGIESENKYVDIANSRISGQLFGGLASPA